MKTKSNNKKLSLNKSTITDLRGEELRNVKGGAGITFTACPSLENTGCISFCGTIYPCSL